MRVRHVAVALGAFFTLAAPAQSAGDPIMPLSEVRSGMRCTGLSVVRGTDISSFDIEVIDVVAGQQGTPDARILVRASGPAIDATGLGPGFSGSPIYCQGDDGVSRSIGAVSEAIGEYGGKVVLATPIEAIIGETPEPPPSARRDPEMLRSARPLAAPLTVTGLHPALARRLTDAGRRAGRTVIATPPGPLGTFPPQPLVPGAAMSVGYSSGDVRLGSVGTVAYADGPNVWAFGHTFESGGARALLLQDAYVFRVISNPNQLGEFGTTYKLAAPGHDLGALTNDALTAVVGRLGSLPATVPVRIRANDLDAGTSHTVTARVADEAGAGLPSGSSPLATVAPLAVAQAAGTALKSAPARVSGELCVQITFAGRERPARFCNRYISATGGEAGLGELGGTVANLAANDVFEAIAAIDAYNGKPPRITEVAARLALRRGEQRAFLRSVRAPRTVSPGSTVHLRATLRQARGDRLTRTYRVRIPADAGPGRRTLTLLGTDADSADFGLITEIVLGEDGVPTGEEGPRSLDELMQDIRALERWDGVTLRLGGASAQAFRDDRLRVSGRASVRVRVTR
jgi:hypothetical protein